MSYRNIHQAIVDKLDADATLDGLVHQVNYSHTKFAGYPAIAVANSTNSNAYQSTLSNQRTYSFSVYVYNLFASNDEYEAAVKAVEDVMDRVIAIFNARDALQPTALITEPVPSSVVTVEAGDEGVLIVGEIVVQCRVIENC